MNAGRRKSLLQAGSIAWFFAHFSLAVAFFGLLVVAFDAKADVYSVHSSWNSLGVNSVYYFSLADAENSLRTTSRCDTLSDFTFDRLGPITNLAYPQVIEGRTVVSYRDRYYRPQFTFLTVPESAGCPVETDARTGQTCWVVVTRISDPTISVSTIRCYTGASYGYVRGAPSVDKIVVLAEGDSLCSIRLSGPGGTNGALADVEPGKPVNGLRAEVMCDGVPTAKEVVLTVRAEESSGGHYHVLGRPNGSLNPRIGNSPLIFSFVAPAPAGDHVITAKCADNSCGEDTGRMWVGRKGLETLRDSQYYILVGDTPNHFDNHYLSPEAINQVYALTALYQVAKFPSDPLLHLNDASLERGGLFDVSSNWAPSHFEHCRGTEIDVRANDTLGAIPEWNYQIFERLAGQVGASAMFEIPRDEDGNALYGRRHFHVRMTGVRPQCP